MFVGYDICHLLASWNVDGELVCVYRLLGNTEGAKHIDPVEVEAIRHLVLNLFIFRTGICVSIFIVIIIVFAATNGLCLTCSITSRAGIDLVDEAIAVAIAIAVALAIIIIA